MGLAQVNIKVKARQKYSKVNEGRNEHKSKSFFWAFLFGPKPRKHPKGPERAAAAPAAGKKKEKIRAEA